MRNPTCSAELTSEWLTDVLDAAVESFTVTDIGVGVGIFGEIVRITPRYGAGHDGPVSVVGKFATAEPANLAVAHALQLYTREVGFYREIAPTTTLRVPHCYFGELAEDGNVTLLLEDLSAMEMGDQVVGISPRRAESVIDALGALHAEWWQSPRLDELSWLLSFADDSYTAAVPGIFAAGLEPLERDWTDRVGADGIALAHRVNGCFEALMHKVGGTAPQTLLHADPRLDNIFFGDHDEVALIDWQLILRGHGASDLAYLIGSSMEPEHQRVHWERLLRRWYDSLGVAGVSGYSWDQAVVDYKQGLLSLLSGPMSLVGTFSAGNERGAAMTAAFTTRFFDHALHIDAAAVLDDL